MRGWIARVKVPPCAKFGDPSSKGVGASAPCGRTFAPSGQFDPMALKSDQGPSGLKVWAPGHPPFWL